MNLKPAPFHLTAEAEKMMRHMLASTPDDAEPSLSWAPFIENWSKEGSFVGRYDGPILVFGHWKKNECPVDSFFEICSRPVSIRPNTLEHIEGRTVDFGSVELLSPTGTHYAHVFKLG